MERTTLGTKLSDIEKKLGGTGEMPPAGTYDPLLWHLDRIESLIGGEGSLPPVPTDEGNYVLVAAVDSEGKATLSWEIK